MVMRSKTQSPDKTVWLVLGLTSGNKEGEPADMPEYQFSDGKPGERGGSDDYTSLSEGIREYKGFVILCEAAPGVWKPLEDFTPAEIGWAARDLRSRV